MIIALSLLFFSLAAVCNSISDTCREKYKTSIFNKLNPQFWDASVSWENKYIGGKEENGLKPYYPFRDNISDAWHIFKSLMILFLIGSIVVWLIPQRDFVIQVSLTWKLIIAFIVYGSIWNGVFSLFYNYILKRKENL